MDTVPNQLLQHLVEPVQLDNLVLLVALPDQTRLQTMEKTHIGRAFLEQELAPTSKSALYSRYLGLRGIKDRQNIQRYSKQEARRTSSLQRRICMDLSLWMQHCKPNRSVDFPWTTHPTPSIRRNSASPVPLVAGTPNEFTRICWIRKS